MSRRTDPVTGARRLWARYDTAFFVAMAALAVANLLSVNPGSPRAAVSLVLAVLGLACHAIGLRGRVIAAGGSKFGADRKGAAT